MKHIKLYECYELKDKDFRIKVKVSDSKITLVNKNKNYKNQFLFLKSNPETIEFFAKALKLAAKLGRDSIL